MLRRVCMVLTVMIGVFILFIGGAPLLVRADNSPHSGHVLFRPDYPQYPYASAGYPRVIRLTNSGSQYNGRLLTVFALGGHGRPEEIPVYESTDDGLTWTRIATVTAATAAGWGIGGPTIFEMPRQIGSVVTGTLLVAGTAWKHDGPPNKYGVPGMPGPDNDFSHQVIEIHKSTDQGRTWSYHGKCIEINGVPNEFGYGIWEPHFQIDANGNLACYFAWEHPGGQGGSPKSQVIAHVVSSDGGLTWSSPVSDVVSSNNDDRPGMPIVIRLPNSQYLMAYELCVGGMNANNACLVYVKTSSDGIDWSPTSALGTLVETAEGHRLAHTPYIAWTPAGGPNGTLILSGQVLVSGNTGGLTELEGSGRTLLIHTNPTNVSATKWFEIPTPFVVAPVGNYNPQFPGPQIGCSGYSSPLLPSTTGTSLFYMAGVLKSADGAQCEIRYGVASIGTLPFYAPLASGTDAGWAVYGGLWAVKDEVYSNNALGPGHKSVAGSTGWMTYTVQSDMRLLSEGQAGLIFRVTNPREGADALDGYYAGLETQYSGLQPGGSLVLGRLRNSAWTELQRTTVPGGVKVHKWYHLTVQAVGCTFTVSVQSVGDTGTPTSFSYTDTGCFSSGQIGLRSHFTRAAWRNISVTPGGTTSTSVPPYYAPFASGSDGWTSYGGNWQAVTTTETYENTSGGAGEKAVAGSTTWTNYTLQGDVVLTSTTGSSPNSGLLVRVTDPAIGVDALKGYYAGINTDSDTLVLGRHNNNWTLLGEKTISGGASTNEWYHVFFEVEGCDLTATVQATDSPEQTKLSITDTGCTQTAGQSGIRTFNATARWRYVAISPR